ncbi:MAG: hypothetical protein ACK43N_01420, partial [Pirellulaceae bacterium]
RLKKMTQSHEPKSLRALMSDSLTPYSKSNEKSCLPFRTKIPIAILGYPLIVEWGGRMEGWGSWRQAVGGRVVDLFFYPG